MFREYDVVISKVKLNDNVPADSVGTILMIYNEKDVEVEFMDEEGNTLDVLTVNKSDLNLKWKFKGG